MSDLRTAAQQALDWLYDNDILHPTKVSENLRAALAQQDKPVQDEPVHDRHGACPTHCCPIHGCKYMHDDCPVVSGAVKPVYPRNNGCESCAEDALAQQAEPVEPVAWEGWWLHHGQHNYRAKPLTSERVKELMKLAFEVGREAAPPQRKPLPKHDQHCVDVPGYGLMAVRLVRAVERAHGIKE